MNTPTNLVAASLLLLTSLAFGQYSTIQVSAINSTSVEVPAGKTAEIINLTNGGNAHGAIVLNGINVLQSELVSDAQPTYIGHKSVFIAGPKTFSVASFGPGSKITCTYRIFNNPSLDDPIITPLNSVVIPENSTGDVQVILESSTDMVTWTAAQPGTYSPSTQKRFFRVRAKVVSP